MKKLEELGISPAPWKYIGYHYHKNGEYIHLGEVRVEGGKRQIVVDISQPDAAIMSAAPDMYAALWKQCFGETTTVNCGKCGGDDHGVECCSKTCPLYDARMSLAKASGVYVK